jgi:hypothetical protein
VEIDTTAQELRLEQHPSAFAHTLAHVVGLFGAVPDSAPQRFPTG